MCELFGYSGRQPLDVSPYLKTLVSHSPEHPHGWGIAAIYDGFVNIEKEPKPAWLSEYLHSRLEYPIEVSTMIAHIRQATCGDMSHINCHPFIKKDIYNRTWTLAHNGTIFNSPLLDTYKSVQLGSTDSERILCHIIKKSNNLPPCTAMSTFSELRFQMVNSVILEIAQHNKLNLLFHDGEYLYVHTNMTGTLYQKIVKNGILFATVPLDEGGWMPVHMMQLLVYANGSLVYQGTQHNFEYRKPDALDYSDNWIGL